MAETARFELAVPHKRYDALARRWFQPLTHVSKVAENEGFEPPVRRTYNGFQNRRLRPLGQFSTRDAHISGFVCY